MELATMGRTGMRVSRICLGAGAFRAGGEKERAATRLVHAALDAGINFIDTADVYGLGGSEEVLGRALAGRRDHVVLVTKFWAPMGEAPNDGGVSRRWIMRAVEHSLRRLRTDYIDLYFQHRPELGVDMDEVLGAMSDLVHQGKVRYLGASSFPAEMVVEAEWIAEKRDRERFTCHEVAYAILTRSKETAVLPLCQRFGAGVITFSPLACGWLGGRHRRDTGIQTATHWAAITPARFDSSRDANQRKLDAVERLAAIAEDAGLPMAQMAIAWVLEHPAVTSVIIGAQTTEQLDSLLPALQVRLDPAILDRIDEVVMPGTTIDPLDDQWTPPVWDPAMPTVFPQRPTLAPAARRRPR